MNKKNILFGFSAILFLANQSWAATPNDINIWTKDGNVRTFSISDVDSITFSKQKLSNPKLYNDWTYPPVLSAPIPLKITDNETQYIQGNNDFAKKCFENIGNDSAFIGKNIFFSPISLTMALAMCSNATNEQGVNEFANLVGFPASKNYLADINKFYNKLFLSLNSPIDSVKLRLANAVWVDNTLQVNEDFYNTVTSNYYSTVRNLDFHNYPDRAKDTINKWAALMTNDCIKELSVIISDQTDVVINNAAYFNGKWESFFKKSNIIGNFITSNSDTIQVEKMFQNHEFEYVKDEAYQAIKINYGTHKKLIYNDIEEGYEPTIGTRTYSMIFLLPNEDKTLDNVLPSVQWNSIPFKNKFGTFELPFFSFKNNFDLLEILKGMGLDKYLSCPNIIENESEAISQIKQDTYINVNESGTEASAVTSIEMVKGIDPEPEFKLSLNRPFAFVIQENTSGLILFMGKVENPKQE